MNIRAVMLSLGALIGAVLLFLHNASAILPLAELRAALETPSAGMQSIILVYGLFPRAAMAILAGAALGLSGALLQLLLRNPIADPSTLGISAGAQLAIVVTTLFFPEVLDGNRTIVALAGAGGAAIIVFALGWRQSFEPVTMVVSGLLVGVTAAALSSALTLAQGEYLMSLVTWNGGSLSQQDWSASRNLAIEFVGSAALAALLARPLLVLGVGDTSARSLGASLRGIRLAVAALATALAGLVAAAVGLVSFVGLAAPTVVRACGARRPGTILAFSPVAGALLLWLCDGFVQWIATATNESFPTGAVTGLIGGPLLLWMLPRVRSLEVHSSQTNPASRLKFWRGAAVILSFLPILFLLAFLVGRTGTGWTGLSMAEAADLLPLRWPRLLAAAAAGGLLAMSGAVLQRMTGNPMASPEVIGVSGGAGLGFAAILTVLPAAGNAELFAGAAAGAVLSMAVVLIFASRRHLPPEKLLLAGIAVGSLSSSVLSGLLAIGDQRAWQILAWLGGSAATATPGTAIFLLCLSVLMLAIGLAFSRWLTVLPLGVAVSQSLGLSPRSGRIVMLLVCGLATGAASLLVGPLSFVGLIAPHIALRAGFTRPIDHLAASFMIGMVLMAFADFGARTATFPYELPLGLFAALIGGPYLIWLVGRR